MCLVGRWGAAHNREYSHLIQVDSLHIDFVCYVNRFSQSSFQSSTNKYNSINFQSNLSTSMVKTRARLIAAHIIYWAGVQHSLSFIDSTHCCIYIATSTSDDS